MINNYHDIKTIDDLVEYCKLTRYTSVEDQYTSSCILALDIYYNEIVNILKSTVNIPSRYDLMLIQILANKNYIDAEDDVMKKFHHKIIQLYMDRDKCQ